jgi:hypothetical protein
MIAFLNKTRRKGEFRRVVHRLCALREINRFQKDFRSQKMGVFANLATRKQRLQVSRDAAAERVLAIASIAATRSASADLRVAANGRRRIAPSSAGEIL